MPPNPQPTLQHRRWKTPRCSWARHPRADSDPAPRRSHPHPAVHHQQAAALSFAVARPHVEGGLCHPCGFCLRFLTLPFRELGQRCCSTPKASRWCGARSLILTTDAVLVLQTRTAPRPPIALGPLDRLTLRPPRLVLLATAPGHLFSRLPVGPH